MNTEQNLSIFFSSTDLSWVQQELLQRQPFFSPTFKEPEMDTITVDKARLLETLKANREVHAATFKEAMENYPKALADAYAKKAEAVATYNGDLKTFAQWTSLPIPEEHTEDFDTAIAMLDWAQGDTIALPQHEFEQYVLNKWGWAARFTQNTTNYTAGAGYGR